MKVFENNTAQQVGIDDVNAISAGSTLGLQQSLLAGAGQPGLTVLAVGFTTSGKVQGVSLGNGNVIEVYASGSDFNDKNVLYREFMSLGEPICFTGLSNGAIITSTAGFYGFSEQVQGSGESPMPLLSFGLSFNFTFLYAFRNSQNYDPGGNSNSQGWIHVVNGPLANTIRLADGSGVTVQGQENIEVEPWAYQRLYTDGNQEYILEGTQAMMACVNAQMNPNGTSNTFYDSRLIMPLTSDGMVWPRSGFLSALYAGTEVKWFVRDGATSELDPHRRINGNPGTPRDIDAPTKTDGTGGTGASDSDYEPNGCTRFISTGLISAYSGADSAGLEASPMIPTSACSQIVAQPLFISDSGDGGNSGVSIGSAYEGTARIYEWNDATKSLDLAYTVPLTRTNVTVTSKDDQRHPAAGQVANESASGSISLVGDLGAGVVIADVPIFVITQNGTITNTPNLRSQNGGTTTSIINDDDETLSLGWTPDTLRAEITEGADGILYRRSIVAGVETWEVV
jgi:hypothetical protein